MQTQLKLIRAARTALWAVPVACAVGACIFIFVSYLISYGTFNLFEPNRIAYGPLNIHAWAGMISLALLAFAGTMGVVFGFVKLNTYLEVKEGRVRTKLWEHRSGIIEICARSGKKGPAKTDGK